MNTYTFDINLDFPSGLDSPQLQNEIETTIYITAVVESINTSADVVSIIFDRELTGDELNELNNIVALHSPIVGSRFVQTTAELDPAEITVIDHAADLSNGRSFEIFYSARETYDDENMMISAEFADDFVLTNTAQSHIVNHLFMQKSSGMTAGTNLAPTAITITASSATQPATNLIDGNATTIWYNASGATTAGQFIIVDMGKAVSIYSAAILWYNTAYYATSMRLECSGDSATWELIDTYTGVGFSGGTYNMAFPSPKFCRFFRLTFLTCVSTVFVAAREIRLFEAVGAGYATNTPCIIRNIANNRKVFTSLWDTVNSARIYYNQPANTHVRLVLSFDSQTSWVYWNGSAWTPSSLSELGTIASTAFMTPTTFNALTNANFKASGGPFDAANDFTISAAIMIYTTTATATASVDRITFNVTTKYFKQNTDKTDVQIRLINSHQTEIKNMTATRRTFYISVNIR